MAFGSIWGIIALLCAVWVIYDVWTSGKRKTEVKVIWTVCAVLFSIVTAIVYFFIGRK